MPSPLRLGGSSPLSGGPSIASTPRDIEARLKAFSPGVLDSSINTQFEFGFGESAFLNTRTATAADKINGPQDKDPFISDRIKVEQKLSPTASDFQPYALGLAPYGMNYPMVVSSRLQSTNAQAFVSTSSGITAATSSTASSMVADPVSPTSSQGSFGITQLGTFSTDTIVTRALMMRSSSDMYSPVTVTLVESCVNEQGSQRGTIKYVRCGNDVLLRFSNISDAINTYNHAIVTRVEWSVEYISLSAYAEKVNSKALFVSAHEGQVLLIAKFPSGGGFDRAKLEGIMLDMLAVDGVVYAFQKQLAAEAGTLRLIVEFCDINSAARALERLDGAVIRGIQISVNSHKPDFKTSPVCHRENPDTPSRGHDDFLGAFAGMSLVSPTHAQYPIIPPGYAALLSPTGRTLMPAQYPLSPTYSGMTMTYGTHISQSGNSVIEYPAPASQFGPSYPGNHLNGRGDNHPLSPSFYVGSPGRIPSHNSQLGHFCSSNTSSVRRQHPTRSGTRGSHSSSQSGQHNVVDISKIRDGIDVRTTIMLRNIPNKVDQETLKSIVDETSRGCYDFMYLRIDFANSCNVGYAFINFDDPWHIIDFVGARAGQRWNKFSSDKVAEVSYATIQGKDCLIQKFRNSSVMLEHPSYRPKIFFTSPHLRAGEEDVFPMPDNPSKMRRSVENAEHVGLFAPRSGQRNRDDQREHRSQYDRGTRLAALEEFEYEDALTHEYGNHHRF